jgi:N-acetylmuramoyl-L-alanine amidase
MSCFRLSFCSAAVFLILLAGIMEVPASAAGLAFINGQSYVLLAQWASANGFEGFTRSHGREFILTGDDSRLVFDIDSSQVEINGINVRLSFPVASQKNLPYISELDINTLLRPLINPSAAPVKKVMTICLDPGHGGRDTGNRVGSGFFAHNEKTYTLQLAMAVRRQLQKLGFNVVLTRSKDVYVPLPARPALANERGADLFVSLHFNASPADPAGVSGPETYCITPVGAKSSNDHGEGGEFGGVADTGATVANHNEQKSLLLAYEMEKALVQNLHAEDRSVRRARYAVLRDARMPAILIEGGYMTNPTEGRKIYDPAYREQMAQAITKGILNYLKFAQPSGVTHSGHTPLHVSAQTVLPETTALHQQQDFAGRHYP